MRRDNLTLTTRTMSTISDTSDSYTSPSPHTSHTSLSPPPSHPSRKCIRSVLMRAGTSRGLFFRSSDLPVDRTTWGPILLGAMGSPDSYLRQLDGVGGGTSTTSKVAVVGPSDDPRADVDYLFVQVPVDGVALDFSGNCGNMASGVGPFSVDEGFVKPSADKTEVTVRIRNVNTNRVVHSTFSVHEGTPVEFGTMQLAGTGSPGSPIRLDFIDPAGSMTGKLLPTGSPVDTVILRNQSEFRVSCVDAANPFIFVDYRQFGLRGTESVAEIAETTTETLLEIRAICAVKMGLASSVEAAKAIMGTPKIALVGPPVDYTVGVNPMRAEETDIWVRAYSMGRPHPSIQMTGAVCVGAASAVPGTIIHDLVKADRANQAVTVGHASGTMAIDGSSSVVDGKVVVSSGSVYRTARRLMEGSVYYMG